MLWRSALLRRSAFTYDELIHFQGSSSVRIIYLPAEKGLPLKGRICSFWQQIYSLLGRPLFRRCSEFGESKPEVITVVCFVKMAVNLPSIPSPLKNLNNLSLQGYRIIKYFLYMFICLKRLSLVFYTLTLPLLD